MAQSHFLWAAVLTHIQQRALTRRRVPTHSSLTVASHCLPPAEGYILLIHSGLLEHIKTEPKQCFCGVIAGMGVGVDGNDEVMGLPLPLEKHCCAKVLL